MILQDCIDYETLPDGVELEYVKGQTASNLVVGPFLI